MKTAVQITFLLLLSLKSFSQTIVWEKLINFLPNGESIYSVNQDSDTTIVFTTSTGGNTGIVKAKLNGDTIWKKNTNINACYNDERIAAYRKGTLMHFGNKTAGSCTANSNFIFQKQDSDGNIISSWEYGDSGIINRLENFRLLPDGGFLASGQRESTYSYYLSLMKLDSSGNMLWYKQYRDISGTSDIIINRKGNYLLSASSGDQLFGKAVYHSYFIEVTPDGDSINSKYLIVQADSVDEKRTWTKWGMLQNEDGDYVFTITIDSVQKKGGTILDQYAAVVMMDTLFNIKWKLYLNKGTGGTYYPTEVIELKDSTYILVVMNGSNTFYYYKISKAGQILDQKIFSSGICNKVFVPEIKLLNDSSLIVSGSCADASPNNDAYLARIDSVGLPMVITATASPKEQASEWSVSVYPNPFNEQINFKITDKPGRKYTLILYSSLGQKVAEYKVSGSEYSIERNAFTGGLYFYKLTDEKGKIKSGKVIAE